MSRGTIAITGREQSMDAERLKMYVEWTAEELYSCLHDSKSFDRVVDHYYTETGRNNNKAEYEAGLVVCKALREMVLSEREE